MAGIFAGNGAVITGSNTFTGYGGVSTTLDLVVFFNQDCPDGKCNNATCWNAGVNCVDDFEATAGVYFMETVNDNRSDEATFNLQIWGAKPSDTLSIDLNGWAAQNISAAFGTVLASEDDWGNTYSDDGSFAIQIGDQPFGTLFQLSVTGQPGAGAPNLWAATVSK